MGGHQWYNILSRVFIGVRVCCVFSQSLGQWIPLSYLPQLSLSLGQCRGVLKSCPHTSLLAVRLQSDSHSCMSGQEGGSEGTEIKDVIK